MAPFFQYLVMKFHLGDLMFLNFYKVKKVSQWGSKSNKLYPHTITSDSHAIGSQNEAGKQNYKTCLYSLVIFSRPDSHWSKYMKMHKHWDTFWATVYVGRTSTDQTVSSSTERGKWKGNESETSGKVRAGGNWVTDRLHGKGNRRLSH